ncbi:MAG: HAMP domain-containing protein [Anaerolineales bacterium]|nr:HAMP domain-containing protein [Anaerolineales bacterium]
MQSIRTRLSLNYLIVLILGMSLAVALAWLTVSKLYVDTQRENLLAQARLIAAGLQDATLPTQPAEPYSQTSNVMPGIHTRLIGDSGAVLVGLPLSDAIQLPLVEQDASISPSELVQRPEIESALKGIPATSVRRVIGNQQVLYAAAPVQNSAGAITGIVYIATPLPSGGLPAKMIWQLFGAVAIAVLLAGIAGGLLARKIATPLEGLAKAAVAISKGDLKQSVPANSDVSELHSLSQTFNEMAESLRQSDEAKKAFIADVTHELRTPLTVIKGTIETLEDGALDDLEGRTPLLTSMMRETDRLIRMVNDLLVLTRADAGALQLNLQTLDLIELARMRCENMSLLAARQHVGLKVLSASHLTGELFPLNQQSPLDLDSSTESGATHPLMVSADPDRLSQVLDNLLGNAIRHSPEHSTVTVTVGPKDGGVECSVSDQGTGIPAKHLPFLFDRFYRVETSRDRISGGTGLGLAIVRALVTAHGGKINVQSIEGKGTTFTIWLRAS